MRPTNDRLPTCASWKRPFQLGRGVLPAFPSRAPFADDELRERIYAAGRAALAGPRVTRRRDCKGKPNA